MFQLCKKALCFVLVSALLLSGCGNKQQEESTTEPPVTTESYLKTKEGIQSMVILCTDSFEEANQGIGFRNPNRADFVMLMVIDEAAGELTSIQLNPDTIVPFAAPGMAEAIQIPLGHIYSYGSGGSDSCLYLTKAVSKLLCGVKVDHYLTFTRDAVGMVNDSIGGVSVAQSDETDVEVTKMSAAEAEAFFFERAEEDISNDEHMARQRLYMAGMFQPFMKSAQNEDFLTKVSLKLGENMGTGLTLSQLIAMFETLSAYSLDENIVTIPGTAAKADGMIQFTVDQAALEKIVNSVFY